VDVIGGSMGRGFGGVVRRHHFRGGAATHGSMFHRAPGSIGPSAFPSRVYPGTRSSGRLGGRQATAKNLIVVRVDAENNLLYLKGAVPGARNSVVKIVRSTFRRPAAASAK
jgi:large subunit ribosomal protein L3